MLRIAEASARIFHKSHLLQLARKCKGLRAIGLLGQHSALGRWDELNRRCYTSSVVRFQQAPTPAESIALAREASPPHIEAQERARKLPLVCPGCGAPSQTVDADAAGFYGSKRAARGAHRHAKHEEEDEIFQIALQSSDLLNQGVALGTQPEPVQQSTEVPICDRCHYLLYQSCGTSIIHPSMQSIQEMIEESPHKHNHIYHVLDAVDFPMSLIPNLTTALKLPRLRTQNRRSKHMTYLRGRVAEVSFIITRSDLLAPKKEQVDTLVPYLRDVLRDALGRTGKNVRLGNVRCVSAKRGWWTKTVKEEIWERGGAGWMVGKANVGKSALYEVVFPKGRTEQDTDVRRMRDEEERALQKDVTLLSDASHEQDEAVLRMDSEPAAGFADSPGELSEHDVQIKTPPENDEFQESKLALDSQTSETLEEDAFFNDETSLLPPAQKEMAYPYMPLVSALPGTTASPIRIPFGNGKGELIDLPGIHRSSLDNYVTDEHRKALVMKSRVVPEQYVLKPGQSILIGGLIRITPKTDDLVFLAYPFVPLKAHVTSNEKAVAVQTGRNEDGEPYTGTVETITTQRAKESMKMAGVFQLTGDVTRRRAGPVTEKAAGKQKAADLPFIVYSADLLIEGVGWIELVCQVRRRDKSFIPDNPFDSSGRFPEVEVWSPEGKFVAIRRPMSAWLLGGPKKVPKHARRLRPRQSISMARRKAGGAANKLTETMTET